MPNFPYKTLVFDMDGTILDGKNNISNELKTYLAKLKVRGYQLILATGRTFGEVKELVNMGEFDMYICANAMTIHNEKFERIHYLTLPKQVLMKVLMEAAREEIYYELRQDEGPGLVFDKDLPYMKAMFEGPKVDSVSDHEWHARKSIVKQLQVLDTQYIEQAVKVYFFHSNAKKLAAWKEKLKFLIIDSPISIEQSSINSCEIVHKDANKAIGLKRLVELGFIEKFNILCFGDSFNDISMFNYAAYSVAMKNANETLKQIANDITHYTNDENGVLHWLVDHIKE